jgi:hypothetical protein
MKRIIYLVLIVFLASIIKTSYTQHPGKNKTEEASLQEAIKELPHYYHFIKTMKENGYVFWDFKTYWAADKTKLPLKLIVIRHDVHERDVKYAYYSYFIEENLIGKNTATYFVMLDAPDEKSDSSIQHRYLQLIHFLKEKKEDVQPHISPLDLYVHAYSPKWAEQYTGDLQNEAINNYMIDYRGNNIKIIVKKKDVFNLSSINRRMSALLTAYNDEWFRKTGLKAEYYAAHGSKIPINLTLINNQHLLDQRDLLKKGIYKFDTYNSQISKYLNYLSDNSGPGWIEYPQQILPGRYQFLMHPAVWNDVSLVRTPNIKEDELFFEPHHDGLY